MLQPHAETHPNYSGDAIFARLSVAAKNFIADYGEIYPALVIQHIQEELSEMKWNRHVDGTELLAKKRRRLSRYPLLELKPQNPVMSVVLEQPALFDTINNRLRV